MDQIIAQIQELLPSEYLTVGYIQYVGAICVALFVLSLIGRFATGGKSIFRGAVGAMCGILFMYVVSIAVSIGEVNLPVSLPWLPFAQMEDLRLYIAPITQTDFYWVCEEFLLLFVLAFFIALFNSLLPKTRNAILWTLRCILLMILAFAAQILILYLYKTYYPATLRTYTPVILLGFLLLSMLLGLVKVILGVAIATINPILAGIYAFFFMHRFGKLLSTAVLTTLMLGVCLYLSDYFGYSVISLAAGNLLYCLPFLLLFLVFWYLVSPS